MSQVKSACPRARIRACASPHQHQLLVAVEAHVIDDTNARSSWRLNKGRSLLETSSQVYTLCLATRRRHPVEVILLALVVGDSLVPSLLMMLIATFLAEVGAAQRK
mmetsp:Transcript_12773/g.40506  ORF Transcript_12773/g.40506 Transcript_12773/m.40506 type:complete len:106 (+) Transcript_12773:1433-1750(+)